MQEITLRADVTPKDRARSALADLIGGVRNGRIVLMLAMQEVKNRYRRSTLGMLWIVISMAVWVATVSFVFTSLFVGVRIETFIPYITISIIMWGYFTNVLSEGCLAFVNAEEYLLTDTIPLSVFIYRTLLHGMIVTAHNFVIFLVVATYFKLALSAGTLLFIPGMLLFIGNCLWATFTLAILCTRFRDVPQIVANGLQILFYLTPIIWTTALLPSERTWFVTINPLFHILEVVRGPLLGEHVAYSSWIVATSMLAVGSLFAFACFARLRSRIAYWI